MEQLIEVLKLAKPERDINDFLSATDLYGQGVIDSLDIIVIVDELNAAFGIELGAADIGRKDFITVDNIYALVQRAMGKGN
jgi:acyl carrier protein